MGGNSPRARSIEEAVSNYFLEVAGHADSSSSSLYSAVMLTLQCTPAVHSCSALQTTVQALNDNSYLFSAFL